ncbi:hypothetical protein AIOL_000740 [Candidatus Rhodobacter oscarellae]|uniref:DUF3859 domain-containing protein n=1 Tax=Candidatus Rhodobacter oscarellae TaxID=1675527 RepID=A0A0J9H4J7_9RHOB|nr:DUF3859 domain-containing protein [Candidatus Rhodobacter lobularis]KMW60578.1 hypothetical protein AIOL_000740 [Candidatus Rhodobacter lobularis]
MRFVLILAFLLSLATAGRAEVSSPGAVFFDYGYFCEVETIEQQEAEGTLSGVVNLVAEPPDFLRQTTIIPAQIGVGFGVHLMVTPEFAGLVTVQTTHPPMGPDGITVETWETEFETDDLSYNGFTFEYEYELVKGPWTLSASANGRLIYSVDFEVVDQRFLPPVNCAGGLLS